MPRKRKVQKTGPSQRWQRPLSVCSYENENEIFIAEEGVDRVLELALGGLLGAKVRVSLGPTVLNSPAFRCMGMAYLQVPHEDMIPRIVPTEIDSPGTWSWSLRPDKQKLLLYYVFV